MEKNKLAVWQSACIITGYGVGGKRYREKKGSIGEFVKMMVRKTHKI